MKFKYIFCAISLLALCVSFVPVNDANALVKTAIPPADMFQLPWLQGEAWIALDGFDNGTKRPEGALFILDDPIFNGLAISLIFGILVSTILTLVVIPVLYYATLYKKFP